MDGLEAIYSRRSIRKFVLKDIPEDDVTKILKAGMSAPTSGNQRPWQFIVIRKREMFDKFIEAYTYSRQMLPDVPVAIMVCFDKNREKYELRWQIDCANATLNMLLAAHILGYGGLWLEIFPIEERITQIQQSFGIPDTVIPFALVTIGHKAEEKTPVDRFDAGIVHYDSWKT
ncbi:nitroreductase family protein [Candidatus Thorarchaeota archaeon]|nr:nitroreductase family protein [Candidatus Thorarchaeota archaeon]TFH00030.1 MAG: nitroreductase family protein [Candidatus Thorarchaeota archaeon]